MASLTPKIIPIRVERLTPIYTNLARALTEAGISGSQLNEILSTRLRARCVKCEIPLASDEIEQVSLVEDPTQLSHPKLKRLRLGYCAREGCESYEYGIHLEACPGVDWDTIAARTNELMAAEEAAAKEQNLRRSQQAQNQRRKRNALGLLITALLLLLMFVWRNGRLPFVKKTHKYQIDPASVPSAPPR